MCARPAVNSQTENNAGSRIGEKPWKKHGLTCRVRLGIIATKIHNTPEVCNPASLTTSFPGPLILLPPGAIGGKMRDPGNEVASLNQIIYFR